MGDFEIRDFNEKDKNAFELLNKEWIQKYFEIEENDIKVFKNPHQEIISKGGRIFYFYQNNCVIGTVSLVKITSSLFELSKMAVTETSKGMGVGNLLLHHAINEAKNMSIKKLVLIGNTKMQASIHLYKKFGFQEVPLGEQIYKRGDIKMELILEYQKQQLF